jgi:hypothetical protein
MTYKILSFFGISMVIFSMSILLYISPELWITIIAFLNLIFGLIVLNVSHYKTLKKLMKYDKDYFNQSL